MLEFTTLWSVTSPARLPPYPTYDRKGKANHHSRPPHPSGFIKTYPTTSMASSNGRKSRSAPFTPTTTSFVSNALEKATTIDRQAVSQSEALA